MRTTGWLVVTGLAFVVATWSVGTGWRQPRPTLASTSARLHRRSVASSVRAHRWAGRLAADGRLLVLGERWSPTLRLIGRTPEEHVALMGAAALGGAIAPTVLAVVLGWLGLVPVPLLLSAMASLGAAVAAPALVHSAATARADEVRIDLRHQLSAYLDMVIMLLAGNSGYEGALEHAARSGDGVLFGQLRRRMREVGTTGDSLVRALALTAHDLDLVELEQVAATTTLSAAQGAPVARTLAAKCSTLRTTIAAEHEAAARVRTDKVTPPLVGMALLFMALIIYPALNLD